MSRRLAVPLALLASAAFAAGQTPPASPGASPGAPATPSPAKPPAPGPGTGPYMTFLKAWFEAADLDKDGYLDKAELAKAFRGPKAVPPADPAPPAATPAAPDATTPDDEPKAASPGAAAAKTPATPARPARKRKPTQDVEFLAVLDTDKDDRVSRAEFDQWAPGYATYAKQVDDLVKQINKQAAAQNKAMVHQQQQALKQMLANQRYAAMHNHRR